MSHYAATIAEELGVSNLEARVIEEVMRVETPTLDHLTRQRFVALARKARCALEELRATDPECARWYEGQAR